MNSRFGFVIGMMATAGLLEAAPAQLRVVVYDNAGLPAALSQKTREIATRLFFRLGIEMEWVDGQPGSSEGSLIVYGDPPPKGHEVEAACAARRDIALRIDKAAPRGMNSSILGISLPLADRGVNVVMFDDRILDAATQRDRPHATVLAYAIAHEIGHVLLRTKAHSNQGVMSSFWDRRQFLQMGFGTLTFAPTQAETIMSTLSGAGCPVVRAERAMRVEPAPGN